VNGGRTQASSPSRRIVGLQYLRALAAYLVVVVHIGILFHAWGLEDLFRLGACGVDIFFVISGFVLTYTVLGERSVNPITFIWHRVARVVPSYWLLTLIVCVIAGVARMQMGGTQFSWPNLVKSLLFIPYERGDGRMEPLLFVGWSLNYEMAFYLAFSVAMMAQRRFAWLRWLALGMVLLVASNLLPVQGSRLVNFYRSPYLLEFVCGMGLARLYPVMPRSLPLARAAAALLWPALCFIIVLPMLLHGFAAHIAGCLIAGGIVGCTLLVEKAQLWPRSLFWATMGDASYALYLTHPFVVSGAMLFARRAGLHSAAEMVLLAVSVLIGSTSLAVWYYRHVEQPLTRLAMGRPARKAKIDGVITLPQR